MDNDDDVIGLFHSLCSMYYHLLMLHHRSRNVLHNDDHHEGKRPKRRYWVSATNLSRNVTGYFKKVFLKIKEEDSEKFFMHTRMSRKAYEELLVLMEDKLTKKSIRTPISQDCRLALTLTFLSQGVTYKFLSETFQMGRTTVQRIISETCTALCEVLQPIYMKPPGVEEYNMIAKEFQEKWDLPHCIGAIDAKYIKLQTVTRNAGINAVLTGVCDSGYKFTHADLRFNKNQTDDLFEDFNIGKSLHLGKLPLPSDKPLPSSDKIIPHYFIGDAMFPLKNNLIRPFPGRALNERKRIFNYRIAKAHRIIENAYGILLARWNALKMVLAYLPGNAEHITMACVALHNYALHKNPEKYVPPNYVDWEDHKGDVHLGEWREEVNPLIPARLVSKNGSRDTFAVREILADYFLYEGGMKIHAK